MLALDASHMIKQDKYTKSESVVDHIKTNNSLFLCVLKFFYSCSIIFKL